MMHDFDKTINRRNTNSYKWDNLENEFGNKDLLPFWVADMDFVCPEPIVTAIQNRALYPVYGYTRRSETLIPAVVNWLQTRFQWTLNEEWIAFSTPGVIYAINQLVLLLSKPGEKVVIITPVYKPLMNVITGNQRVIVESRLIYSENKSEIDFKDLEKKLEDNAKIFILCSPHNPSGRVWTHDELTRIDELCRQNNVFVLSDEIHADIIFKNYKHIHFSSLSSEAAQNSITCISASKTFNISGLSHSTLIIANNMIRKEFNECIEIAQINLGNIFSECAVETGYSRCSDWLDQVIDYIEGNVKLTIDYLAENIPSIEAISSEGTYMMWLDFSKLGLTYAELDKLLIFNAGLGLACGRDFNEERFRFYRINVACPRKMLLEGLTRLRHCINLSCK